MIPITPPPRLTGLDQRQQLDALYKYLYTLAETLNLMQNELDEELRRIREGGEAHE